jgi:hypothetical protein
MSHKGRTKERQRDREDSTISKPKRETSEVTNTANTLKLNFHLPEL